MYRQGNNRTILVSRCGNGDEIKETNTITAGNDYGPVAGIVMATKRTKTRLFLEKASFGCVTPPDGQLRNWIPETELDQQEDLKVEGSNSTTELQTLLKANLRDQGKQVEDSVSRLVSQWN